MNRHLQKRTTPKATVCVKNTCATVHGDAARIVEGVVVTVAVVAGISLLAKLFRG